MQSSNTEPSCCSVGPITDRKHSFTVATLGKLFFPLTAPYFLCLYPLFTLTETHMHITMEMDGGGRGWMRPSSRLTSSLSPFIFFHSFLLPNCQVWPSPPRLHRFSPLAASSGAHATAEGIKIEAVGQLKKPSRDPPGLCPQVKTVSPEENCIFSHCCTLFSPPVSQKPREPGSAKGFFLLEGRFSFHCLFGVRLWLSVKRIETVSIVRHWINKSE